MRIGRLELSLGFLVLMAWLNYMDRQGILPLVLFACLIHELGHLGAIWWFGGRVRRMRLSVVGAELQLDAAMGYIPEGIIALAGPGVNLVIAVVLSQVGLHPVFSGINLVLGCFNLLPLGGLDGGRTLRCVFELLIGADAAERAVCFVNRVGISLLVLSGAVLSEKSGNYTLLLIGVWMIGREMRKKGGFRSCQSGCKRVK